MIPDSVSKAFENPDTKKVISSEGIYWRNQKAYDEDPDKYKDTRLCPQGILSPPHRAFPRVEGEPGKRNQWEIEIFEGWDSAEKDPDIGDLFLK